MPGLLCGVVRRNAEHAASERAGAFEEYPTNESAAAPLVVGGTEKLDTFGLKALLLPVECEEDAARGRARQGLEALERSLIQAKEQIRQEAQRLGEEEERMRTKAKEAGRRFAQIEEAGRAKVNSYYWQ